MTISSSINRYSSAGNGVATAFSYNSRFLSDSDLVVVLVVDATGIPTTQVLNTDYTVAGAGESSGGTITMMVAPATGETLVIYGNPPITQGTDWVENDPDPAEVKERAFDKLTLICARLSDLVTRSLRFSDSDTTSADPQLPTPEASTFIGWNPAGDGLTNYTAADIDLTAVTTFMATLLDDASATEARATLIAAKSGANGDITSLTALTAPTVAANPVRATDEQVQLTTAFTTGGSSTAYTLTPAPAISSLVAGQRFRVKFHTTGGVAPTLAISGQTAKSLKLYNSSGVKTAGSATSIIADMLSDIEYDGTDYVILNPLPSTAGFTLATPVASTSGTSITFTGIPSGVKQINIMLQGVSTNGTSNLRIRIGPSGGVETTGYLGAAIGILGTVSGTANSTAGFDENGSGSAAGVRHGMLVLSLLDSSTNTWVCNGGWNQSNNAYSNVVSGSKPLAGVLERVAFTTVNGTDTFDAGSVNISYSS